MLDIKILVLFILVHNFKATRIHLEIITPTVMCHFAWVVHFKKQYSECSFFGNIFFSKVLFMKNTAKR